MESSEHSDQCRICLESSEAMVNLFEDSTVPYKILMCCGVEIEDKSFLPSKICKKCSDILNLAYGFRVLCQRSQEYLCDQQTTAIDETTTTTNAISESKPSIEQDTDLDLQDIIQEQETESIDNHENEIQETYDEIIKDDDEYFEENDDNIDSFENTQNESSEGQKENDYEDFDDKADLLPLVKIFKIRAQRPKKNPVTFMCNICGNLFRNKATFNYHMKLHRNEKKYECEICSKRFMQTCELQAHIRVHTGEKPFKCSYCDRKFTDRSGVTRHERTHTNERPYGCTICGAKFSYSATLKKHERVHTGEKPYRCFVCDKGFSEAHQMKAHMSTIRHGEMVKEKEKLKEFIE